MSDIEYSVIKSDVIKSFDCISNTKADQNTLFRKYVFFEPPRLYF